MTLGEKRLWEQLRKLKLHVRRQAPLGRFVVDFVHHASRIVFEIDSPWHDGDEAQLRDAERDAWLKSQGYRVIRIRDGDVLKDAVGMSERIASVIKRTIEARKRSAAIGAKPDLSSQGVAYTPTPAPPPLRGRGPDGR